MLTKFLKRKVIKALKTLIFFILDVDPDETKVNILDLESFFLLFQNFHKVNLKFKIIYYLKKIK